MSIHLPDPLSQIIIHSGHLSKKTTYLNFSMQQPICTNIEKVLVALDRSTPCQSAAMVIAETMEEDCWSHHLGVFVFSLTESFPQEVLH